MASSTDISASVSRMRLPLPVTKAALRGVDDDTHLPGGGRLVHG
jgi:hypothetical protein